MARKITQLALLSLLLAGCPASRQQQGPGDKRVKARDARPPEASRSAPTTKQPAATPPTTPARAERPLGRRPPGLRGQTTGATTPCTGPGDGAAVICVDDDKHGKAQRGTATAPYSSIGAALKVAKRGDTIRVAAGTYKENVAIRKPSIRLLGGFAADFASRQPSVQQSTIHGVGRDAAVVVDGGGASVVDGFRITGGTGNERQKRWFYLGGGVYASGGSPTISANLIEGNDIVSSHRDNDDENQGAGIYAEDATVRIIGNVVRRNKTSRGAVAVARCRATIQGNSITDNLAIGDHGGGMYLAGPRIEITDNFIARNRLVPKQGHGGWGGGVLVLNKGTRAILRGNVVTGNSAPVNGSAVFIDDGAEAHLENELYVDNACSEAGGAGLYVDGLDRRVISRATVVNATISSRCPGKPGVALFVERARVTVTNSILWGNGGDDHFADRYSKLTISYSITEEKTPGKGNKRIDPLFVDPKRGDFHLRSRAGRWHPASARWVVDEADSPAIDGGDPRSAVAKEQPPNGNRRNLGAYGGTAEASLTTRR